MLTDVRLFDTLSLDERYYLFFTKPNDNIFCLFYNSETKWIGQDWSYEITLSDYMNIKKDIYG